MKMFDVLAVSRLGFIFCYITASKNCYFVTPAVYSNSN